MKLDTKIITLLLIGIILLISPLYFRIDKPVMGSEPYLYGRAVEEIRENGLIHSQDKLNFSGRSILSYALGPMILLYLLNLEVSLSQLLEWLPIVLGVLTILLSYHLLKKIKTGFDSPSTPMFIILFSPAFLYLFTKFTNLTFAIPLTLIGFSFFISEKKYYKAFSSTMFLLLPFFGFWEAVIPLSILLILSIKDKENFGIFKRTLIGMLIIMAVIYGPNLINPGAFNHINNFNGSFKDIFFDLGGGFGASIFTAILALFGLSLLWEKKYKNLKQYILLVILIIFSAFYKNGAIYLAFLLCFLASKGILKLRTMRWESKEIKNVTIFILFCGVIFSGVSFLGSTGSNYPTTEMVSSLNELNRISQEESLILSHPSNGNWINYVANRKTFVNEEIAYIPDIDERTEVMNEIFESRNILRTEKLLKTYKIKYVYITPNMKEGLVWKNQEDGFLFVAKYSQLLEKKYEENGIEIWRIKQ